MNQINGDLLASQGPCVMVHACNSLGVMGAGLANQVRLLFPQAERAYLNSGYKLGSCSIAKVGPDRWMANLITQATVGREGKHTIDWALELSLSDLLAQMEKNNIPRKTPIYLPVGMCCGLGGGDWAEVLTIIKKWEYDNWLNVALVKYTTTYRPEKPFTITKKKNLTKYK